MAGKIGMVLGTVATIGNWVLLGCLTGTWIGGDNPLFYFVLLMIGASWLFLMLDEDDDDEQRAKSSVDMPLAVGTVVDVHRTRRAVGDEPVVRIDLDVVMPDGARFRAKACHVVRAYELDTLGAGTKLPVHVNPAATDGFVTIATTVDDATAQDLWQRIELAEDHLSYREWRVLTEGRASTAVVMRAEPTGRNEFELDLHVTDGFDAVVVARHPNVLPASVVTVRHLPGEGLAVVQPHPLRVPDLIW